MVQINITATKSHRKKNTTMAFTGNSYKLQHNKWDGTLSDFTAISPTISFSSTFVITFLLSTENVLSNFHHDTTSMKTFQERMRYGQIQQTSSRILFGIFVSFLESQCAMIESFLAAQTVTGFTKCIEIIERFRLTSLPCQWRKRRKRRAEKKLRESVAHCLWNENKLARRRGQPAEGGVKGSPSGLFFPPLSQYSHQIFCTTNCKQQKLFVWWLCAKSNAWRWIK